MDISGYEQVQTVADPSSIMEMYNIKDKDLADAAAKAMVDGNMTPLIKEELKCSIQLKRLKAGKPELKVEFTDPESCQLTETEQMKVEKRKIQNRLAAQRFRNKQKTRGDQLHKECLKLQSVQTQLRFELSQVKKERDELKQKLQDHYAICPLRYTTQYYSQQNSTG
ncbi:basic leucine zipper transcriptional factor ATF-like 3 isoform X4 [Ruditapes philippinarum]|uniref:basic leucine zipper transcriptional factor ATF-like 3 isoform X4 n=1 Tax=Ruditapes philippinarum TaxID=129788 RepID=UPI00295ABB09|nr:basic leucine zipper transcriptional factor ATF-like 3 isoform X4 [Ruditapes philippinarum]